MSIFLLGAYGVVLVLILIAALIALNSMRSKGSIARALNMALFSISLPRPLPAGSQGASQRPEKELIGIMEQLYGSFTIFTPKAGINLSMASRISLWKLP